jgi:hypothetical protein
VKVYIAVAFELEKKTISSLRENYLLVNILALSLIVSPDRIDHR